MPWPTYCVTTLNPADSATRECREEIGAEVEITGLLGVYHIRKHDAPSMVGIGYRARLLPGEAPKLVKCRMRSLGCAPCTGAIRSDADTLPKIVEEMISFRRSERENRAIDHDEEGSMELKKREGYF